MVMFALKMGLAAICFMLNVLLSLFCRLSYLLVSNYITVKSYRHLAGEVAKEWQEVEENDKVQQETLLKLVKEIVPYNMAHNAEHEACDLLMEIERLDMLEDYIDENAYGKVCLYLTRYVCFIALKMQIKDNLIVTYV